MGSIVIVQEPDLQGEEGYEVNKLTRGPRFCRNCENYKPPRAHHCRQCKRYVIVTSTLATALIAALY